MGQGWRRVSEAVRQKIGLGQFKETSNARNEAMFKEATDFLAHLRTMERDLKQLEKQVEAQFTNMRNILLSPLPRAYANEVGPNGVETGGVVPIDEETRPIGQNVHIDRITAACQEMKRRLKMEVLAPIQEWIMAYRTISDRMRSLEALRLELDSRRRTVGELVGRLHRVKSNVGGSKGDLKAAQTEQEMIHKQNKMQTTSAHFLDLEQTVYNSLYTLVKDTCVLREYAAAALQIVQECYRDANSAFDANAPALEYSTTAPGFGQLALVPKEESGLKGIMRQLSNRMLGDSGSAAHVPPMMSQMRPPSVHDFSRGPSDDRADRPAYDQMGGAYGGFDAAPQMGGPKMMPAAHQRDVQQHTGHDNYSGMMMPGPQYSTAGMQQRTTNNGAYAPHSPAQAGRYAGGMSQPGY